MLGTLSTSDLISIITLIIGTITSIIAAYIAAGKIGIPKKYFYKIFIAFFALVLFIILSSLVISPYLANLVMGPQTTWQIFQDNVGSTIQARSIIVDQDYPLEFSFDLKEWGYVGASHLIDSMILSNLSNTTGIKFYYRGTGQSNSFTIKLEYRDIGGTQFESQVGSTLTSERGKYVNIPYSNFTCARPEANCECYKNYQNKINSKNIKYVAFVASNSLKEYDTPGKGHIVIDKIQTY
jgi:hypothetical protein